MLPPLNENGELPPGVHEASWSDIERRFGRSEARARAFAKLKQVHELAARTGALRNFYAFGSFVSAAPHPRDVDVFLVMDRSFRLEDCPEESRPLFSHLEAQARHGVTVFWTREGVLGATATQALLRAWQTTRDGKIRGIVEIA